MVCGSVLCSPMWQHLSQWSPYVWLISVSLPSVPPVNMPIVKLNSFYELTIYVALNPSVCHLSRHLPTETKNYEIWTKCLRNTNHTLYGLMCTVNNQTKKTTEKTGCSRDTFRFESVCKIGLLTKETGGFHRVRPLKFHYCPRYIHMFITRRNKFLRLILNH
jgi:hypothetical protein